MRVDHYRRLSSASFRCSLFGAEPSHSRRNAARLQAKLDRLPRQAATQGKGGVNTPITEAEMNSYLRYELSRSDSRPG